MTSPLRRVLPLSDSRRLVLDHDPNDHMSEVYISLETRENGSWRGEATQVAACDLLAFVKLVMGLQDFEREVILGANAAE